jgi:rubredoxin
VDQTRRCPDCDVTLQPTTRQVGGTYARVAVADDDGREGLDSRSPDERRDVANCACPECGLVRSYVPTEAL